MKRILLIFMLAAAAFSADARKLTILHMNDTHSHIEPERNGENAGKGGVTSRLPLLTVSGGRMEKETSCSFMPGISVRAHLTLQC